jgi:hypothetical protein
METLNNHGVYKMLLRPLFNLLNVESFVVIVFMTLTVVLIMYIGVLVRDFILKPHTISELKTSFQSNIDRIITATLTKLLHNFII